jgi:hypothetical protein
MKTESCSRGREAEMPMRMSLTSLSFQYAGGKRGVWQCFIELSNHSNQHGFQFSHFSSLHGSSTSHFSVHESSSNRNLFSLKDTCQISGYTVAYLHLVLQTQQLRSWESRWTRKAVEWVPWNLLFIECSYLEEAAARRKGQQKLLMATMAGSPDGWPRLSVPPPPTCERLTLVRHYLTH